MTLRLLAGLLRRRADAHKYNFGHVLVVGGSPGMVGAPLLAGEAALRTGAGLVTIASHPEVIDKLEKRVREIMTLRIPPKASEAIKILNQFIRDRKVSVLIVGPGQDADFAKLNEALLRKVDIPVVIDAGAFTTFYKNLKLLKDLTKLNPNLILTPHSGEYQRLSAKEVGTAEFAKNHHVTLVLKGHQTLVTHPNGTLYQNTTGNPGLATAGTGDVLSGIIAGLLAQGLSTANAAECGVYLHGIAGDLTADTKTQPGMIASDVIEHIPASLLGLKAR